MDTKAKARILMDMFHFSPLYKSSVVLRQLTTAQAKRRGRRALEVGWTELLLLNQWNDFAPEFD